MDKTFQDKEDWIYGYKVFGENLPGLDEQQIELGKIYVQQNDDKGQGFCFGKNLDDCLVFARDAFNTDVMNPSVYQVCGCGEVITYYNEYYDVEFYMVKKLKIIKRLNRDEIVQHYLAFHPYFHSDRLLQFIKLFYLTQDEILLFKDRFKSQERVIGIINYYQEERTDPFIRQLKLY